MKRLKNVICLLLLTCVTLSSTLQASASNASGAIPMDGCITEPNYTAEQQAIADEKAAALNDMNNQPLPRAADWVTLRKSITIIDQEQHNYCGPACVSAIIKYFYNFQISQTYIANACNIQTSGTYLSDLVDFLDKNQNENVYVPLYKVDKLKFLNAIYLGIFDNDAPSLLGIAFQKSAVWKYNTDGHFVLGVAIKRDRSSVSIGDPNIRYIDSGCSDGTYEISNTLIYNAYNSVNIGMAY